MKFIKGNVIQIVAVLMITLMVVQSIITTSNNVRTQRLLRDNYTKTLQVQNKLLDVVNKQIDYINGLTEALHKAKK
jgi:sensor domain CHASE-containing protein